VEVKTITADDALALIERQEGHFWDAKSKRSGGSTVQKIGTALANADGGEFAMGIEDRNSGLTGLDRWSGYHAIEDANYVHQSLVKDCDPPVPYTIDWLNVEGEEARGLVALIGIGKSASVHRTSEDEVWVRHGAQNLRYDGQQIIDLTLSKGATSYEDQFIASYRTGDLAREPELLHFLESYSPATDSQEFVEKQRLVNRSTKQATVAAAVLYAETPPAVVPKKCSVKIARYETKEPTPSRDHLIGTPASIEGPAREVIEQTIKAVTEMVEAVSYMTSEGEFVPVEYPPDALKEIIVNAVIHRDYNISDDTLVEVFDNRVVVKSPGRLPGHMTLDSLLTDRFARNPTVVRLLNKYPDPPNKDIGEGLRTVLSAMKQAKLKEPVFAVEGNYFLPTLAHTPLARPEELVMEYLAHHDEITNRIGRDLCGIASENAMKDVFYKLRDAGQIERVPLRFGSRSAWRKTTNADAAATLM
jgi:ATP-dependent DNA helicase RecG